MEKPEEKYRKINILGPKQKILVRTKSEKKISREMNEYGSEPERHKDRLKK